MATSRPALRLWAAVAALALVAMACQGESGEESTDDSGGPLTIGAVVAQTGFLAEWDVPELIAAEFAVEDFNAQGGILGRQLEIIYYDTKSEPANGTVGTQELIDKGADIIIVSGDFDFGSPAAIAAAEQNMLAFSPGAASTRFGEPLLPLAYSLSYTDVADGASAADFGYNDQGYRNVYILEDTFITYTKRITDYFETAWTNLAGEESILGHDTFSNADPSIAAQITRIKSLPEQPDFVYLASLSPGGGSALRQLRGAGISVPIIAGSGMDGTFWLDSVPGLSDFWEPSAVSILGDDPNPKVNELVERFVSTTGEPPKHSLAITGYSIIEAIATAAERAESLETDALVQELNKFENEAFVAGPTTFTPQYHVTVDRPMAMMEVNNGEMKFLKYVDPEFVPEVVP